MNSSFNYSGFVDMYFESDEKIETYECRDTTEALVNVYNSIQTYKAGFDDREYVYDK